MVAILCDSLAYRAKRKTWSFGENMRGIVLSLLSGVLMGSFYPFASRSMTSARSAWSLRNSLLLCDRDSALFPALPNYLFMKRPVDGGTPVNFDSYLNAPMK